MDYKSWGAFLSLTLQVSCTSQSTRKSIEDSERLARSRGQPGDLVPAKTDGAVAKSPERELGEKTRLGRERVIDRDTLVRSALSRHPALRETRSRVLALAEAARADGSLPPPELGVDLWQVPLERPYAVDDAGMLMVSLRQEIPAAGSLDEKAAAGAAEARASAFASTLVARQLVREVDAAFADYIETTSVHAARSEHVRLLRNVRAAAEARYAAGGSLSDVTRADLELARAEAALATENGRLSEIRARLVGLAALPVEAELGPPRSGPPLTASASSPELVEMALRSSPAVAQSDAMRLAASRSAEAAETESSVPSLAFGLNYFAPVGGMPNGYGASFGMSLPWLWGESSGRSRAARQKALAEGSAAESARLRARTEVTRAHARVKAAERRFIALKRFAEPSAARAVEVIRAAQATGGSDVLAWLEAQRDATDVAVELATARGDLERALSDLDAAVGVRVGRAPVELQGAGEGGSR